VLSAAGIAMNAGDFATGHDFDGMRQHQFALRTPAIDVFADLCGHVPPY
jgi:hypothetical protein